MPSEIIVEIGNLHEGSVGIAKSLIDMVSFTGAKIVKFQMHIAEEESTQFERFRVNLTGQDKNRYQYWRRTSFTEDEWQEIYDHSVKSGLEFLCTPFSNRAAEILMKNGFVKRWKVGSGDATNLKLLDFLAETKLDLILSTGLMSWDELLIVKNFLEKKDAWKRTTLLYCISKYPAELTDINLESFERLKELKRPVGFSDHTGKLSTGLLMLAKSVPILEVHMTPDRLFFGPDNSSSLTFREIQNLVSTSTEFDLLKSSNKSPTEIHKLTHSNRLNFRKGIYWHHNLAAGVTITASSISIAKPVSDFEALDYFALIGSKTTTNVVAGMPVLREEVKFAHES